MEQRETVIITEKKQKIENIKKKYKNLEMSDETATKISRLEVTNKILKGAAIAAGVLTAIDIVIPDPVPGIDEAILGAITILLKSSSSIVENKIEKLANSEDASVNQEEISNLSGKLINVARLLKSNLNNKKLS